MVAKPLKSERREEQLHKKKTAPKGGTVAAQAARMRAAKGYRGSAKKMVRRKPKSD